MKKLQRFVGDYKQVGAAVLASGLTTAKVSAAVALVERCLLQKSCKQSDDGGTTALASVVLLASAVGESTLATAAGGCGSVSGVLGGGVGDGSGFSGNGGVALAEALVGGVGVAVGVPVHECLFVLLLQDFGWFRFSEGAEKFIF